jgi:hypothetical protein
VRKYSLLLEGKVIKCVSTIEDPLWIPVEFAGTATELATEYAFDGGLKYIGPCPGPHYFVSPDSGEWVINESLVWSDLAERVSSELERRLYLPCNGFDADQVSRDRIGGMIARLQRGDGLPVGWVGWRDTANEMQWVTDDAATVLANLTTLSRAIEDREQALLVASWQHKANIAALTDIDAIIGYDVTKNWPT